MALRRWAAAVRDTAAVMLTFVGLLVAGTLLHSNLPTARRVLARLLGAVLSDELRGTVLIGRMQRLEYDGITLGNLQVFDEQRRPVLEIQRLRLQVAPGRTLWDLATARDKLTIVVSHARADGLRCQVLEGSDPKLPSIVEAFQPNPKGSRPSSRASVRPYRIWFPTIEVGHTWARVELPGFPNLEIDLSRARGFLLATPEGVAVNVSSFSTTVRGIGGADLQGVGSFQLRSPDRFWGTLTARLGDVPLLLRGSWDNGDLQAALEVPRANPAAVRALWTAWPLQEPADVEVHAAGHLPEVRVQATVQVESMKLRAEGHATLDESPRLDLSVTGKDIDISKLAANAPSSSIEMQARTRLAIFAHGPEARFEVTLPRGTIEQVPIPPTDASGFADRSGLHATAQIHEPGLPIEAKIDVSSQGAVDLDARARSIALERVPRLKPWLSARALADAQVRVHVKDGNIDTDLAVQARDLDAKGMVAKQARARAHLSGPASQLHALTGFLDVTADDVKTPAGQFRSVQLHAHGSPQAPKIQLTTEDPQRPAIELATTWKSSLPMALGKTQVHIRHGSNELVADIDALNLTGDHVVIKSLALNGSAGTLRGDVQLTPRRTHLYLQGDDVDLALIARALGLDPRMYSGHIGIQAQIDGDNHDRQGSVRLTVDHASFGVVTDVAAEVRARLDGQRVLGTAVAQVGPVVRIDSSIDATVDGALTDLTTWEEALGKVEIDANVQLSPLDPVIAAFVPIERLDGTCRLRVGIDRPKQGVLPDLSLSAATSGLSFEIPRQDDQPPLAIRGVETVLGANLDAASGDLNAAVTLHRHSAPVVSANLTTYLDVNELARSPADTLRMLASNPTDVAVRVVNQRIRDLPVWLGLPAWDGMLGANVAVHGSLAKPIVVAALRARQLAAPDVSAAVPMDVDATARYDQENRTIGILATAGSGTTRWLEAGAVGQLLSGKGSTGSSLADWKGHLQVSLSAMPLQAIPPLAERQVTGSVRGSLTVDRDSRGTVTSGLLPIDQARLRTLPLGQSLIAWRTTSDLLVSDVQLIDGGAHVELHGQLPVNWLAPLPTVDQSRPARVTAKAVDYDAGILSPLLGDAFGALEGRIDGRAEATITPTPNAHGQIHYATSIGGEAHLTDGSLTVSALGLALKDIALDAQASSNGTRTLVHVPRLQASIRSQTRNLSATADLVLDDLVLTHLTANIDRAEDVPLTVEGVTEAELTGQASLEVVPSAKETTINIDVDNLVAKLPRTSARNIQNLLPNPEITVLQPLGEQSEVDSANQVPVIIRVDLGDNTSIDRADMTIPISGHPTLELGQRTRPSGEITLKSGGRVQLLGKVFIIDQGFVRLNPDEPTNPWVDVTATWRGPTHLVTVNVQGTSQHAKLRLSSDPPVSSEEEAQAMLVGSADGQGSTATAGVGLGAAILGELFADTALGRVELRTSQTEQHANYTAAVPIRENLWFEATYQNPETSSIRPGSASQQSGFSGTVDWRFEQDWSLRTDVGTLGAGLDLLWQYRY